MPFVEVQKVAVAGRILLGEISIRGKKKTLRIAEDLMKYLPSKSLKIYIDVENKLLGLQDEGKFPIGVEETGTGRVYVQPLSDYKIKDGRYKAVWSAKKKMLIGSVQFDS